MSIALDIRAILEHLPHRYPFLLVDRVLSLEKGKTLTFVHFPLTNSAL